MRLWPMQAAAISEARDNRGLLAFMGVGAGKSLTSLLIPRVLDAKRPLLLVPSSLVDQTINDVIPAMAPHWHLPENLAVRSYNDLSILSRKDFLQELEPDYIGLDEAHAFSRQASARTKRFLRYLYTHPDTILAVKTGTPTKQSIKDYQHLARLSLRDRCPLPIGYYELNEWALALDEDVPEYERLAPGALMEWAEAGDNARQAFHRRLVETPGVIISEEGASDIPLTLHRRIISVPSSVDLALRKVRETWTAPDGTELVDPTAVARKCKELASGYYLKWDPPPPAEWLEARSRWARYVRHTIRYSRKGLDTEKQVRLEAAKGNVRELLAWKEIEDTYSPRVTAVWISDFLAEDAAVWLRAGDGIAWVLSPWMGERVAELSGYPYFGQGLTSERGLRTATGPIIASIQVHGTGRNLQRYSRNLVVHCPSAGDRWQQLIGRTRRYGQKAERISFDVYLHTPELEAALEKAVRRAEYVQDTIGEKQALLQVEVI